jgi:hypothetical protein
LCETIVALGRIGRYADERNPGFLEFLRQSREGNSLLGAGFRIVLRVEEQNYRLSAQRSERDRTAAITRKFELRGDIALSQSCHDQTFLTSRFVGIPRLMHVPKIVHRLRDRMQRA